MGTTLLAIMMSLLTAALFSIGRSARAGEARLDATDSRGLIRAFLREQIAGAVPLTTRVDQVERVFFEGLDGSLLFVGHLPAHRGGGGLQYLQLEAEERAEENSLVLSYRNAWADAPFAPAGAGPDWQRTVLLTDIADLRFRYFGSDDAEMPPRWSDRWVDRTRLPTLVEVELDSADGSDWPALSIVIHTRSAEGQARLVRTEDKQ